MDANGTHLSKEPIQTNGINDTDQLNGISDGVNNRFVNGLGHANGVNGHFGDTKLEHSIHVSHSSNPKESLLSNGAEAGTTQGPEPVAIVGMAVRLPGGVQSCSSFWDLLINKRDGRCRVPSSRYNVDGFYSTDSRPGAVNSHHGYFLQNGLEHLDASFFSMIKTEVESVDPQQRMLLEVVRECLESAGETAWRGKKIGCYVGVYGEDWLDIGAKDTQSLGLYRITGAGDFVIANRISYEYDFRGPSMVIRTACSSSLLGLHMACQALYNGECSSAIIGGTNLIIGPTMTIAMTEQGVLSPTGSCKTFDANADGYARGEAINAIYIKKLSDAVRDGDPIRAIVRATAANSDGKTPGIPSPSSEAHEALMRRAYQYAGIDPSQTGFVECHGTGTQTGDPLETGAVARVFGKDGVFIGSVKPNVGHSEGASGLTSVIKTVLALENRIIPPQMHFSKANPKIPFETAQLKIPLEPTPWPEDRRERASVNSFGIGGANAHVILESSASYSVARSPVGKVNFEPRLLIFSANHAESYRRLCASYQNYLQLNPSSLSDLAYTLGCRREYLNYRGFSVVNDSAEIEISPPAKIKPGPMEMIFVFTGQGAQWAGMGKELFLNDAEFRADIQYMDQVLASLDPSPCWRIQDELLRSGDTSNLRLAEYAQPMVTAIQIGIVKILRKWNVTPDAVVGHSSGEIAAAFSCGALSSSEAIIVAYYRGLITTRQTRAGGMAAIGLGRNDVFEYLVPGLAIACENSPQSVTISGDIGAIDELIEKLRKERPDILARKLQVDMAYHSRMLSARSTFFLFTSFQLITTKEKS
ncbi:MAG: hypothetical protein Q9214_003146 [Letrouitia sp. 1 TL-2023]